MDKEALFNQKLVDNLVSLLKKTEDIKINPVGLKTLYKIVDYFLGENFKKKDTVDVSRLQTTVEEQITGSLAKFESLSSTAILDVCHDISPQENPYDSFALW